MDIDLSRGFLVLIHATQTLTDQALDDKNGGQALEQFAETRLSLKNNDLYKTISLKRKHLYDILCKNMAFFRSCRQHL